VEQTQKKINYIVLSTAPTMSADLLFLHCPTGETGSSFHPSAASASAIWTLCEAKGYLYESDFQAQTPS